MTGVGRGLSFLELRTCCCGNTRIGPIRCSLKGRSKGTPQSTLRSTRPREASEATALAHERHSGIDEEVATPTGFEPVTCGLGIRCSI